MLRANNPLCHSSRHKCITVPASRLDDSEITCCSKSNRRSFKNLVQGSEGSTGTGAASSLHEGYHPCIHIEAETSADGSPLEFLCFPPYCAPGGLRERIFPERCSESTVEFGARVAKSSDSQVCQSSDEYHLPPDSPSLLNQVWRKAASGLGAGSDIASSSNQHLIQGLRRLGLLAGASFLRFGDLTVYERAHFSTGEKLNDVADLTHLGGCGCFEEQQRLYRLRLETKKSALEGTRGSDGVESEVNVCFGDQEENEDRAITSPSAFLLKMSDTPTTMQSSNSPVRYSKDASKDAEEDRPLPPALLVYHESARSIVFRDHLRRQANSTSLQSNQAIISTESSQSVGDARPRAPLDRATASAGRKVPGLPEHEAGDEGGAESDSSYGSRSSQGSKGSKGNKRSSRRSNPRRRKQSIAGSSVGKGEVMNINRQLPQSTGVDTKHEVLIGGIAPVIDPLALLELGPNDEFEPLLEADPRNTNIWSTMSKSEQEVVEALRDGYAVVKTTKNSDWAAFLGRFSVPVVDRRLDRSKHEDRPPSKSDENGASPYKFNSFVTSTTLLPAYGEKMRCYGSTNQYTAGVIFILPRSYPDGDTEEDAVKRTRTWAWPAGYSAKTEFNIDHRGSLINGREEALVSLDSLRRRNHSYLNDEDHEVGGRVIKGGLQVVPYNEVYVRVGGVGRTVRGTSRNVESDGDHSFDNGVGLPAALFVRTASYSSLVTLLRTRARCSVILGKESMAGLPLLMVTPELGVRVITENLQKQLLKAMARNVNPFQNPMVAHKTTIENASEKHMQQKLEELLDLDADDIRQVLTPDECARLAGGWGATDDSVARLLMDVMRRDIDCDREGDTKNTHGLQEIVNDGLEAAVRSGDYNTSRQLLILYTLVASKRHQEAETKAGVDEVGFERSPSLHKPDIDSAVSASTPINAAPEQSFARSTEALVRETSRDGTLNRSHIPPPPPPPPLDTDRLRSATNSDGLLAVLGAAQVLKAMKDGSAKIRLEEAVLAIEEWVENGEQSVAFRLASWRDQRAAQGDLKIAMENDSNFMAFVSNKAIANRKKFAQLLRDAVLVTDFESLRFLQSMHALVSSMNSPCLRLELLQYILNLDNRYSVAHVARSIELAATCMSISAQDQVLAIDGDVANRDK